MPNDTRLPVAFVPDARSRRRTCEGHYRRTLLRCLRGPCAAPVTIPSPRLVNACPDVARRRSHSGESPPAPTTTNAPRRSRMTAGLPVSRDFTVVSRNIRPPVSSKCTLGCFYTSPGKICPRWWGVKYTTPYFTILLRSVLAFRRLERKRRQGGNNFFVPDFDFINLHT